MPLFTIVTKFIGRLAGGNGDPLRFNSELATKAAQIVVLKEFQRLAPALLDDLQDYPLRIDDISTSALAGLSRRGYTFDLPFNAGTIFISGRDTRDQVVLELVQAWFLTVFRESLRKAGEAYGRAGLGFL